MPTYCRISRSTALTCFCAALSQLLQELLRHSHSAVLMRARYDVLSQRERSVSVGQATGQTQLLQGSLLPDAESESMPMQLSLPRNVGPP